MNRILASIEGQGAAFSAFEKTQNTRLGKIDERLSQLETAGAENRDRLEDLESRRRSPGKLSAEADSAKHEVWIDKNGERIDVLGPADLYAKLTPNRTGVGLGRWLRGVLTGKHASANERKELAEEIKDLATTPDASGGYTVPAPLAGEFIDALRSAMVLSRVGGRTVPMTSKTLQIARIDSDAATAWHAENASITPTEPVFGAATLNARTVVCVVKLSLELSQDAPNIEEMLRRSIIGAMAGAIDKRGLLGVTGSPPDNGPNGIITFNGRKQITSVGAVTYDDFLDGLGLLIGGNVPLENVGPIVLGTKPFIDLAKTKTGIASDLTTLAKPPALTMPFIPTTACHGDDSPMTSTAFMSDWRDLLIGMRKDITIRILTEALMASNLQIAVVAYARVDFAPARAKSFVTLEGIA